jgi:hypothetical protein
LGRIKKDSSKKVAKKSGVRIRHIPQRTCVGCREILPKRTLTRLVRTPEGVVIDPTGKLAGRGAYLHNRRSCWESGLKGALARALKCQLADQDIERLREFMLNIREDEGESNTLASQVESK